ncbi:MAG: methyltransferase domain-containing protein [Desulfocapsaceae bacterium]|nr:methyltransferase domain-containing protein [Desulfocapsaceae bacterium]
MGKEENAAGRPVFTAQEKEEIRQAIRRKYAGVASSAAGFFRYPVGKEGALSLGYKPGLLDQASDDLLSSFCGVGNPFAIGRIERGDLVLDIGCGAGFDVWVASRLIGENGRAFGVDLTAEMVAKAQANLASVQAANAEIRLVASEQLPFADAFFDVVISNGVINLSPDKPRLFSEINRVLKTGGRLQFADIIVEKELPAPLAASVESWSQ